MPGLIIQYRRCVEQFTSVANGLELPILNHDPGAMIFSENNNELVRSKFSLEVRVERFY